MGKSLSHALFKMYILLLYFLKSKRTKKNWKTFPSHSIFIFHTFTFSLVELYKNYQCEAFLTCDSKYICLKRNRVFFFQIQDISLNSCIWTYLRPLRLHTLVPDVPLFVHSVCNSNNNSTSLVCEPSLLLSLWPAVNEHNCSADISTILESKAQLDHLVNPDCSDFTKKDYILISTLSATRT